MDAAVAPPWTSVLFERFRRYFLLKAAGTTIFISIFFVAYFSILRATAAQATTMPLTVIDDWIAFQPAGLVAYVSLWVYVGLPPALFHGLRDLLAYGVWVGALCIAGLACFWLWPTAVPPNLVGAVDYPGFELLHGMDAPGNACPSLHVATAAFSAIWLDRLLREIGTGWRLRAFNWLWFVAIVWSTMAVKQHVSLDVLAGCALAVAFAIPSLRLRPRSAE